MPIANTHLSTDRLWDLVLHQPQLDPIDLTAAIDEQLRSGDLDFRTRLLIRDSIVALRQSWGEHRTQLWIQGSSHREQLEQIASEELGEAGFSSLAKRIMESTKPETVRQYLRELGRSLSQRVHVVIGGSIALILPSQLSRYTSDIDIVDEVPKSLRDQHELLNRLDARYGLKLAHFQSHYLPDGWESRVKPIGNFDQLDVALIDPYDITLGKFFSRRDKDRDDLRVLATRLSKSELISRLPTSGAKLRSDPTLEKNAIDNWHIIYGEPLPN